MISKIEETSLGGFQWYLYHKIALKLHSDIANEGNIDEQ